LSTNTQKQAENEWEGAATILENILMQRRRAMETKVLGSCELGGLQERGNHWLHGLLSGSLRGSGGGNMTSQLMGLTGMAGVPHWLGTFAFVGP